MSKRAREGPAAGEGAADSEYVWTFLSNYAHVLVCIAGDPDLTVREIADRVGITERATHRLVNELESAGALTRHRDGRRNHYEVNVDLPMRHPLEEDKTIGDLLAALLGRSEAAALGLRTRTTRKRSG